MRLRKQVRLGKQLPRISAQLCSSKTCNQTYASAARRTWRDVVVAVGVEKVVRIESVLEICLQPPGLVDGKVHCCVGGCVTRNYDRVIDSCEHVAAVDEAESKT